MYRERESYVYTYVYAHLCVCMCIMCVPLKEMAPISGQGTVLNTCVIEPQAFHFLKTSGGPGMGFQTSKTPFSKEHHLLPM